MACQPTNTNLQLPDRYKDVTATLNPFFPSFPNLVTNKLRNYHVLYSRFI